jgi:hypothetical protein
MWLIYFGTAVVASSLRKMTADGDGGYPPIGKLDDSPILLVNPALSSPRIAFYL